MFWVKQSGAERVCETEQAKYQPKFKMIANQMGCRPYYDPGQCVYIFEPLLPLKHRQSSMIYDALPLPKVSILLSPKATHNIHSLLLFLFSTRLQTLF